MKLRNKKLKCRSSLYLLTSFSSKTTPLGLPNLAGLRKYGFLKKVKKQIVNYYQNIHFIIENKFKRYLRFGIFDDRKRFT